MPTQIVTSPDKNAAHPYQPCVEHHFIVVKTTWQTIDYARYQRLDHSKERVVCGARGKVVDPFPEIKGA